MDNSADLVEALAENLWQVWRLWSERSNTPEKLSAEQYWVLRILERESSMTVSGLAARRGVTRAAMSIATQRMESAGWVERVHSTEDQRQVLVGLTQKGRQLWLAVSRERQRVLRALLRSISPEEQETLHRIAAKMRGMLDEPLPSEAL
jgi:DNA-binding MarR family transcriptional regulator